VEDAWGLNFACRKMQYWAFQVCLHSYRSVMSAARQRRPLFQFAVSRCLRFASQCIARKWHKGVSCRAGEKCIPIRN